MVSMTAEAEVDINREEDTEVVTEVVATEEDIEVVITTTTAATATTDHTTEIKETIENK